MSVRYYQKNSRGFTLVELLVVITIIGVLASLAAGGAIYVRGMVVEGITKTQLGQMDIALEAYKTEFGEYPPMLNDQAAVERHAASRWKRATVSYADILTAAGLQPDVSGDANDVKERKHNERIAASLTFWLGGLYDPAKESYDGFSANLEAPLSLDGQRTQPLFDFSDKNTLQVNPGDAKIRCFAVYKKPVVYFRSTASGDYNPAFCIYGSAERGDAVPYKKSAAVWHGAKKYQLIHPGRDDSFGERLRDAGNNIIFPCTDTAETGIVYEDYDNTTNFTETATLKGALP